MNNFIKLLTLFPVFTLLFSFSAAATGPVAAVNLNVTIDAVAIECHGGDDGVLSAVVDGGLPPYDFQWSDFQDDQTIYGLEPGEYSVTITDDAGTIATASYTLVDPDKIEVTLDQIQDASCDEDDGAIFISISGGQAPYEVTWQNGDDTEDLLNVDKGSYAVLIEDANGCKKKFGPWYVDEDCSDPCDDIDLTVSVDAINDATCDQEDGSIYISVSGGQGPYEFVWANGDDTEDLIDAPDGVYTLVINYGDNCSEKFGPWSIHDDCNDPCDQPNLDNLNINDDKCDQEDGAIFLSIENVNLPHTFIWSNGSMEEDLQDVGEGTYSMTLTDNEGCTFVYGPFDVENTCDIPCLYKPSLGTVVVTNADCGENNGSIDLTIEGSDPPFTFDWNYNGLETEDIDNLPPGNYGVVVTDAKGCEDKFSFEIKEDECEECDEIVVTSVVVIEATCGNSDGSAFVNVLGGPAGFTYTWSPNVSSGHEAIGIPSDTYSVTISNGDPECDYIELFSVGNSDGPQPEVLSTTPASCNQDNGTAVMSNLDYLYVWDNGHEGNNPTNLTSGAHLVTVTDPATNCTNIIEVVIEEITILQATANIISQPSVGMNDGEVEIIVTNGSLDYTFIWSDGGPDTDTRDDLAPGAYSVTVTDNGVTGCEVIVNFVLFPPNGPTVTITGDPTIPCIGGDNGSVDFTLDPPNADVTVIIVDPATGQEYENGMLPAGNYCLTATDNTTGEVVAGDCFEVVEPDQIDVDFAITDASCLGLGGIEMVDIMGGNGGYNFDWSNIPDTDNPADNLNLEPGDFVITVTDALGCEVVVTVPVGGSNDMIEISTGVVVQPACGQEDGSIEADVEGGSGDYTFNWNGTIGANPNIDLPFGMYDLTVTDNVTGCTATTTYELMETSDVELEGLMDTMICADTIGLSANATNATLISWYNANNELIATGANATLDVPNPAELITVIATDAAGCSDETTFMLGEATLELAPAVITAASCDNAVDGSIVVDVIGGSDNVIFIWDGVEGTNTLDNAEPGTYELEVIDQLTGCSLIQEYTIDGGEIDLTVPGDILTCEEALDLAASSNADLIQWFDEQGNLLGEGTDLNWEVLEGVSEITVVASSGADCEATESFTITPDGIEISAGPDVGACFEEAVTLDVAPTGYTYVWSDDPDFTNVLSNGEELDIVTGTEPGTSTTYYVQGTNANGCIDVDTVVVDNNGIAASLTEPGVLCPESEFSITALLAAGVLGNDFTYTWDSPDGTITTPDLTAPQIINVTSEVSTEVTVVIESDLGCTLTQTIPYEVAVIEAEIMGDPLEIEEGESTTLELLGYDSDWTLNWYGDESLTSTIDPITGVTPLETTTIYVEIIDENGCATIREITITVSTLCSNENLFFPNAFTPNDDSVNDVLYLRGKNVTESYFAVYDRWGEKVYESFSMDQGWDGTYKGKKLCNDVYGYYLRVRCSDGEQFFQQGNVSLLR